MTQITSILLFSGILFSALGWLVRKRQRRWYVLFVTLWTVAGLLLAGSGYSFWYYHRPQPRPVQALPLFTGVTYNREIQITPRRNVVHIVTIDLDAPGIDFLVTPGDPKDGRALQARTTSQFVAEFGVQLAINGGFFYPFYANGPLWFYPHVGDPVDVYGFSMAFGQPYSPPEDGYDAVYISKTGNVSIGTPVGEPYHALSGFSIFLNNGEIQENFTGRYYESRPSPRTAVALDTTGRQLMLVVVDGRQPNYSEGMSLPELAEVILRYGGKTALNLDGGGSVTLVMAGANGKPRVLNSPIHGRVPPGRERPVANHLGIFALPPDQPIVQTHRMEETP